jgi:hypothetical protein
MQWLHNLSQMNKVNLNRRETSRQSKLFFKVCYLTTLSVAKLYSVDDRIINECGAVGGMRIGRGNGSTRRKLSQCHFLHHISHRKRERKYLKDRINDVT